MNRMAKYKISLDKSNKYKTNKYRLLIILEKITNIRIYYWKCIRNVLEM